MGSRTSVFVVVAAILLSACGGNGGSQETALTGTTSVFAASSLTDSFKTLGTSFQAAHPGATVQFNFAGSPTRVPQKEQGAPAAVFASADTTNMDKLKADGFTGGASQVFAHNKLEIIVAAGKPKGISVLDDLAKPRVLSLTRG